MYEGMEVGALDPQRASRSCWKLSRDDQYIVGGCDEDSGNQ